MRQISAQEKVIIPIGRQGENGAAEIIFDVSGWADLYGNGAFELLNRRPAENTPYTCSITVSDEQVHWIVQSADVALVGHGRCELTYVVDDVIAKSVVFATCVLPSIEGAGEVPEPYESRIQDLIVASAGAVIAAKDSEAYAAGTRDGADVPSDDPAYHNNSKYYSSRANSSANTAQGYASDAGTSAAMSSGSALKSEGFAVGTANGRAVASTSPYYHNNSKYYSEQASGSATAAAGSATAADGSASAAAGSATAADESATAAAGSKTAAEGSATAAAGSASAAAGSATAAARSASDAAAQLALVTAEGTRQVGLITAEGTTQKNAVIAKGQEVIESIPEDYSDLTSDVEDLKSSIDTVVETTRNTFSNSDVTQFFSMQFVNGQYVNTAADTRGYLAFQALLYNGSTLVSSTNFPSADIGRRALTLTPSQDITNIILRHSGQTRDIAIKFTANLIAEESYVLSVYIVSNLPGEVGGFIFEKVQLESGTSLTQYVPNITSVDYIAREDISEMQDTLAPKASPALTGTPTAPTAARGTVTTQIATTAFAMAAVNALGTPFATRSNAIATISTGNLNDYTTPGNWIVSSSSGISNKPVNGAGRLLVIETVNSSNQIQYFIVNEGVIYYRTHNASGWTTWAYLLNTAHYTAILNNFSGYDALIADKYTAITANADFNDYNTPGNYKIASSSIVPGLVNIPESAQGKLTVLQTATPNNLMQIFATVTYNVYYRMKDGLGWHEWQVVSHNTRDVENRSKVVKKGIENQLYAIMESTTYNIAFANAPAPLQMKNYIGDTQNVHPKVLYFQNKFGNHYYWMAYTPYPGGNDDYENPCIAYSDDGYIWTNIASNPIDTPEENAYLSDTHLVYRNDTSTLECWYRAVVTVEGGRIENIYRMTSTDGITWGNREMIYTTGQTGATKVLSPAVIWDGTNYNIWVVDSTVIRYYTASPSDLSTWTLVRTFDNLVFTDTGTSVNPWHLDVIKDGDTYIMLVMCMSSGAMSASSKLSLFIATSSDNISYSTPTRVVAGSDNWDNCMYRSSIVKIGEKYRIYYSATSLNQVWGIGITESNTLSDFIGRYY